MKKFIKKICPVFFVVTFFCIHATSNFVIKSNIKSKVCDSKNTLKEKVGYSTRQAINFTTELCTLMGKIKINFSDCVEQFCEVHQLGKMQKSDGYIQVHLSSMQNCFTNLVETLIDNKGFFKKASRTDLVELVNQINSVGDSLRIQIGKFEKLSKFVGTTKNQKQLLAQICSQFEVSANELDKMQEKVKGLKCLKKI